MKDVSIEYKETVAKVLELAREIHRTTLQLYDLLEATKSSEIWRESEYPSFSTWLQQQCGISPIWYDNTQNMIATIGRQWIEDHGREASLKILRVKDEDVRKTIIHEIAEHEKQLGRPVSATAIEDRIKKYMKPQRPIKTHFTETDRLRMKVRELEVALANEKKAHAETKLKLKKMCERFGSKVKSDKENQGVVDDERV